MRRVLATVAMAPDAVDRLVLAAAEAFNNIVLHADCESFTVNISLDGATCVIGVTDSGRGFYVPSSFEMPPATDVGHRGLALMHELVDRVHVASSSTGTVVRLAQGLDMNRNQRTATRLAGRVTS